MVLKIFIIALLMAREFLSKSKERDLNKLVVTNNKYKMLKINLHLFQFKTSIIRRTKELSYKKLLRESFQKISFLVFRTRLSKTIIFLIPT